MNQTEEPIVPKFFRTDDAGPEDEPTFWDFLRFVTAQIQANIEEGRRLQKEIDEGKTLLNAAMAKLMAG